MNPYDVNYMQLLGINGDASKHGMDKYVDWAFSSGSRRTRCAYPYSYDAYFLWREFDKDNQPKEIGGEYSDRLRDWDYAKYEKAHKDCGGGWIENLSKEQAIKFINSYYDGKYKCVGFAACCNVSRGYGIGIFYIQPV